MSNKKTKINLKNAIADFVVITVGTFIAAAAIFFFMVPSHVAVGSGSALAMVLSNFIPLPISVLLLFINGILLILGFILIGPEFGAKTVYAALMVPTFMGLLEIVFPDFKSLTNDPLLDVLCYVLVVSIGMAMLFSRNASSGGLDIVAKIMNKYLRMDLGKASSVAGIVVALSSAIVYDTKTVVLSVLGTYFGGIVLDKFIFGMGLKKKVCIISPKLELFRDYIINNLHSGATIYESYGAYDNASRKEIVTIVDKSEFRRLMEFIRKTDPTAFVTVYAVNEMQYQPKKWKE